MREIGSGDGIGLVCAVRLLICCSIKQKNIMEGRIRKLVTFFVATVCIFGFVNFALGASYETHEQVPGSPRTDDFPEFLNQLYTFGVGSAAVLAMIMIGAGSFIYIVTSAGNASKMANGKDIIVSSLYGLLIAMITSV